LQYLGNDIQLNFAPENTSGTISLRREATIVDVRAVRIVTFFCRILTALPIGGVERTNQVGIIYTPRKVL
jgi:hypothetical protein